MGYIGKEKKQKNLPANAQRFKPENGFPIEANNRERLKWQCPTCSYIFYCNGQLNLETCLGTKNTKAQYDWALAEVFGL
ncbi:hypothetical protein [Thalassotalea aquiviva]|uniref:hypothetical protein n=1 Tax=Thalassotalea aquiviva TaxID=3242415 RepID=UPI00352A818A